MSERALEWLQANADRAVTYHTFADWCNSPDAQPMGELYATYKWLPAYWECLKERGFILPRPLLLPKARSFADLFKSAVIVRQVALGKGKGTAYPAPEGYVYIGEDFRDGRPTIAGHYGGTRSLDPTRTYGDGTPICQHFGATWCVCYVKPKFDVPGFPSGRFSMQTGLLRAIQREDGVLITAEGRSGIGSEWVALLDAGDSLESLLSAEDQEFLQTERAAEKAAYENATLTRACEERGDSK